MTRFTYFFNHIFLKSQRKDLICIVKLYSNRNGRQRWTLSQTYKVTCFEFANDKKPSITEFKWPWLSFSSSALNNLSPKTKHVQQLSVKSFSVAQGSQLCSKRPRSPRWKGPKAPEVQGPRQKCKAPEVESPGLKESTKAQIVSAIQGSCEAVAIAESCDDY